MTTTHSSERKLDRRSFLNRTATMVGAAVGPGRALLTIFTAAFLAAVVFLLFVYPAGWLRSKRSGVPFEAPLVPFGVFLAPAALLTLLWGYPAIRWYLDRMMG